MSPWTGAAADLANRIAAFVTSSLRGTPTEPFDDLALAVHRWQARHAPVVASLAEGPVRRWTDVPAVPVGLFKDLPVGTIRQDEAALQFRTSGTTGGGRGVHRMRSHSLYDLGAQAWADRCVRGRPALVAALLDDPASAPDSSLSHMVKGFGPATWHVHQGVLDVPGLTAALTGPRFIAATAFALAEWLGTDPAPLPDGSVLMVTGGFKGRIHALEGDALYEAAHHALAPARIVTEYGMTELSSQLWGTPATTYLPPPWLRVLAVDPVTTEPRPPGQPGQLRFYDLCNLDSHAGDRDPRRRHRARRRIVDVERANTGALPLAGVR